MSLCTGNLIDLGYFRTCDTITTGLTAGSTGTFKIRIASTDATLDIDFAVNDAISFSNVFNDDSVHIFQILTPAGAVMSLNGSTCFRCEIRSRTYTDDSFSDAALGNCRGTSTSSGTLNSANFTTVQGQAAYTVAALNGKTIVQVTIGENIIPVGSYGLAVTTLTFSGFTVPGTLNAVVLYK